MCPSNNKVAFKITIGHVIDQIVILKATSIFDEQLYDINQLQNYKHIIEKGKQILKYDFVKLKEMK
jgi:hypothetical protein